MPDVLAKRLAKLRAVFDVDAIASLRADDEWVARYYRVNRIPYTLFHSADNFVHVGISRGGRFRRADLFAQPALVETYVQKLDARRVLELAAGRGPNCAYLARRNPSVSFIGLDRSEDQLEFARKAAAPLKNFAVLKGDFHDLSEFEAGSFDIVFIIEAYCYSEDKRRVLADVKRILRPGGVFIIYDAYRRAGDGVYSEDQQTAARLAEHGMAVNRFEIYDDFRAMARAGGFNIVEEADLSAAAIPTCARFERLARIFFKAPLLARALWKILPPHFTYNGVTGYVLAELLRQRVLTYWLTVLGRSES